jgi:hypothetical protein
MAPPQAPPARRHLPNIDISSLWKVAVAEMVEKA